ncbi:MAG: GGDEF domain-containing protein [Phycisphaerae bacterium]|nr:GGDEF domain-containing protein [Phycisphaerae bacterium]
MQTTNQNDGPKTADMILIVGNIDKAVINTRCVNDLRVNQCESMLDAIPLASRRNYTKIFIVMSGLGRTLDSALETLRKACKDTKIILLAEMYEEPIAMRLIRSPRNPKAAADDYFICPVENSILCEGLAVEDGQSQPADSAVKDEKLAARIRHLERLATQDDLTNLKNRRYVREFLKQILDLAKKEYLCVTLLIFDIDNFKHYNDSFGHAVGDNVLRQAAVMMQRSCREHDVIARIGGDEFAVVFWDKPQDDGLSQLPEQERRQINSNSRHPSEVFFITERFRNEISTANLSSLGAGGKGELTISGGLASFPRDGRTVEELFEQADKAMLQAKRSGKNQIYLVGNPGE